MENNYGFGKFEVLTVIVLLLAIGAFLAYTILGGTPAQKKETMKNSAVSFSKAVTTNMSSFHNSENVYLGEAVDEKIISNIKNPNGGGYCSSSESKVQLVDGMPYVTLKCGKFLLENANFSSSDAPFYEVSEWSEEKKTDDDEERVLYNCMDNGAESFDEYYEELYFVYQVNQKYETSYYFAASVSKTCEVVSKTFYRTKKEIK